MAATLSNCAFSQTIPQARQDAYRKAEDSTLVKMVKGIDQLIKYRAKRAEGRRFLESLWHSNVTVMNGDKVEAVMPIDSLQNRYHISDIKNITIAFDEKSAFYGVRSGLGVLKIYKKDSSGKQNK